MHPEAKRLLELERPFSETIRNLSYSHTYQVNGDFALGFLSIRADSLRVVVLAKPETPIWRGKLLDQEERFQPRSLALPSPKARTALVIQLSPAQPDLFIDEYRAQIVTTLNDNSRASLRIDSPKPLSIT